jgi:hypothetical protein
MAALSRVSKAMRQGTVRTPNLSGWEAVRDQLDGVVRAVLADGDEVELR